MKTLEEFRTRLASSITVKAITIGILLLLLLIPMEMIKNLITERELMRVQVVNEVNSKWGNAQTICGPVLSVPFFETLKQKEDDVRIRKLAHFLPDSLSVDGEIIPEIRYRGIYQVIAYSSVLQISGSFSYPDFTELSGNLSEIDWANAVISLGITDLRGIQKEVLVNWEDLTLHVEPGVENKDLFRSGISATPKMSAMQEDRKIKFDIHLSLDGSGHLFIVPVGKSSDIQLDSPWPDPGFDGAFLPDKRNVTKDGFTATWNILNLNRNYPQSWVGKEFKLDDSSFGVSLLLPVDQYQKSMRSAKYAVMFIGLTFLAFLIIEVLNRKKIHPFQYLLISFGLIIFYTLLISLSEQMRFNYAYIISSLSVILLISVYTFSILKKAGMAVMLCSLLTLLYGFLFIVLQLQEYALLMGSIGLFLAIASVMFVTRKINWYGKIQDE
ncbi:MAG: cell envelope integrity protein CreD [Bacteroidia bacterium]|nr:cell envelope integrity protein CreD [Bacteroidia bacterium]